MSRQAKPRRQIHGIVLLDKPRGDSSNRALQRVKRLYGAAKAGHTGSLDPLATGMLPICLGEATKIAGLLLGAAKAYVAEGLLGVTTASADAEGEVTGRHEVPPLDRVAVEAAMAPLRGRITQVPPVYSALKQGGVPLYRRARRGEDVVAPPREVDVHRFELLALDGPRLRVAVECGSGTYVRSLIADLGAALGCGAHVTALRRLWVEPFRGQPMHTLEALEDAALRAQALLPVDAGLTGLPQLRLDAAESRAVALGQALSRPISGLARAYGADGRLLALVEPDGRGLARVRRGFNLPAATLVDEAQKPLS